MSVSKQDRQGARTPADLERRYNFGKSFAEVRGIATDAQTHAYNAEEAVKDLRLNVVGVINASAETIQLKSNRLVVQSDHFELTAEGKIKAEEGVLGGWDISSKSIYKNNGNTLVQIMAPESEESDFLTVSLLESNEVIKVPLSIKGTGDIHTKGKFYAGNERLTRYVCMQDGIIRINGAWQAYEEHQTFLLMTFRGADDEEVGLFVRGAFGWDNELEQPTGFTYEDIYVAPVSEVNIGTNPHPWL